MPGMRLASLELERMMMHPGKDGRPARAAGPEVFRQVLAGLISRGWVAADGDDEQADRVILPVRGLQADQCWSCTCDVTVSLFETTLSPTPSLHDLSRQQVALDAALGPVLAESDLTLLQLETQPAIMPSRRLFARTAASWRQPYQVRAQRGEDAYWASWIAGSTPCIDVGVGDAIRALAVMHRLTPIALLLSRSGSIIGGSRSPGGRLTVRPWAHRRVFASSPYAADLRRVLLPVPELRTWTDYFRYLLTLPTFVLCGPDGSACRVAGDRPFDALWAEPGHGLTIAHLEQLQRHVFFTRPRWQFGADARLADFQAAYRRGEPALVEYLEQHLTRLYLELRPDSPAPPGEDLCLLALWLGLLEDLDATEDLVEAISPELRAELMEAAQFMPFSTRISGQWLPDLAGQAVGIADRSLARRGNGESHYLGPVVERIDRARTPAEDIISIFSRASSSASAVQQIIDRYAWRPVTALAKAGEP